MKPTVGLAFITNEVAGAKRLVNDYGEHFDKIYITVADKDKTLYHELKRDLAAHKKVKLSYFKWVKHFGKARLFNQKQIKTDYWFWMDCDDSLDHPELIRPLVHEMVKLGIEMMFLNYNYYQNEHGEGQADHWRERIIKTDCGATWHDAPCHETVNAESARCERSRSVTVLHHKTVPEMEATVDRNAELLLADWKKTKDPRTAYYLGMTYMTKGKYEQAVKKFLYLIDNGGWDEQKVTAWVAIADCFFFTKQHDKAIVATNMAIHLNPKHPDPYYQKVIIYCDAQQYDKAIEWGKIALTKKPDENTMQLVDPTKYSYKGQFLIAQAYLFSGQIKEAFDLYQKVKESAPHFIQAMNLESKVDWDKIFEEAYYDSNAIDYVRYLTRYFGDYGGKPQKLWEALPRKIFSDVRLNPERVKVYPPKKWAKKTIAYYCGPSVDKWGPDMLENGVGGSEEAVIYLSRELAKLGWQVTVFGDREDEYDDNGVIYKPWTELNPFDKFDVFIASRQPANLNGVKARLKVLDMHDVNQPEQVYAVQNDADKIFVKSQWHRGVYPEVPDDKFVIVSNGILEKYA